ncbi:MAG: hypothetical protein ACR2QU_07725 [Gammaproteobacteria bacterium]
MAIVRLDGQAIKIRAIYDDSINGGVYFEADLVHGGKPIELQRNRWTDARLEYKRHRASPLGLTQTPATEHRDARTRVWQVLVFWYLWPLLNLPGPG